MTARRRYRVENRHILREDFDPRHPLRRVTAETSRRSRSRSPRFGGDSRASTWRQASRLSAPAAPMRLVLVFLQHANVVGALELRGVLHILLAHAPPDLLD